MKPKLSTSTLQVVAILAGAGAALACSSGASATGGKGVGAACTATTECGSDPRASCFTAGEGYPGGYCSMEPCDATQTCPSGSNCVSIGSESPACFKSCASDSDCRKAEGYICQLFLITPPDGFGPGDHACAFPCKRDPDCKLPLTCDVPSGKCKH